MWDSGNDNTWNPSNGIYPDIKSYLNEDYYNNLNRKRQDLINFHKWNVGGLEYEYAFIGPVKTSYNYEINNSNNKVIDIMKVGLMYVSDYGYAFSPEYWIIDNSSNGTNSANNWIFAKDADESGWYWTISKNTNNNYEVFYIINGRIGNDNTPITSGKHVYPCFYLTSSTEYLSGSETQTDPIRIN